MTQMETYADLIIDRNRRYNYKQYSRKLKDVSTLEGMNLVLNNMLQKKIFPYAVIISQIIKLLGKYQYDLYFRRLYHLAISKNIADAMMYAIVIDTLAKSREPDVEEVSRLLDEAKAKGFADTIMYASTIDAIAKVRSQIQMKH